MLTIKEIIRQINDFGNLITGELQELDNKPPIPSPPPPLGLPADFNEIAYLRLNPDVAAAVAKHIFTSGAQHYLLHGRSEGRNYKDGTPPPLPQPLFAGMNLTIGDLLVRDGTTQANVERRANTYLNEIAIAGHKKVRMPMDDIWGPQLLLNVIPHLRTHGLKLLTIVSAGAHEGQINPIATREWIRMLFPAIKDLLIGVQIANEQWVVAGGNNRRFEPAEFAAFHNAVSPTIRELVPDVPIVEGDLSVHQHSTSFSWFDSVVRVGLTNLDVVSLHPYNRTPEELRGFYRWVKGTFGSDRLPGIRYQVTETDLEPDLALAQSEGITLDEWYYFAWNVLEDGGRYSRRPGKGLLP